MVEDDTAGPSSGRVRRAERLHPRPFQYSRVEEYPTVIGCDEVGRGALCGPVIVAAIWFDPRHLPAPLLEALDDSKRLTAKQRERIAADLLAVRSVAVQRSRTTAAQPAGNSPAGSAKARKSRKAPPPDLRLAYAAGTVAEIDRLGIRVATLAAMARAVERLGVQAPVVVDGMDIPPGIRLPVQAQVRGDSTSPQIAAASIVAKVLRDRLLARLGRRYPDYGWHENAGYGTRAHLDALARLGPSPHHRLSFRPLAQGVLDF